MKISNKKSLQGGFTLIELLIVIAVLGVLAAVVLVAINPLEQLARGRDAGRKNTAGQLHNAVQAFYTARGGQYPTKFQWLDNLATAGELTVPPQNSIATSYTMPNTAPCTGGTGGEMLGYCYNNDGTDNGPVSDGATDAIVYVRLESNVELSKCTPASGEEPYFLWHALEAQAGVVCSVGDPAFGAGATYAFL